MEERNRQEQKHLEEKYGKDQTRLVDLIYMSDRIKVGTKILGIVENYAWTTKLEEFSEEEYDSYYVKVELDSIVNKIIDYYKYICKVPKDKEIPYSHCFSKK
jgi:hypothetical protein